MATNIFKALTAMGIKAVAMVVHKMDKGYNDPHPTLDMQGRKTGGEHTDIRWHGDLMRDVNYEVEPARKVVHIGNSLKYAIFIHEGTRFLKGRPYLKDAITEGTEELKALVAPILKEGMTK
jgi:hypothetical protein